jgi:hypothetical protein
MRRRTTDTITTRAVTILRAVTNTTLGTTGTALVLLMSPDTTLKAIMPMKTRTKAAGVICMAGGARATEVDAVATLEGLVAEPDAGRLATCS